MYDPETGRFLGVDVMRSEMPGWNTYHYTFNNPVRYVDPDGNSPECPECNVEAHNEVRNAFINEASTQIAAVLNLFKVKTIEVFGNIGRIGATTDMDGNVSYSYDADASTANIEENGEVVSESFSLGILEA